MVLILIIHYFFILVSLFCLFEEINAAYELLSDAERRKIHQFYYFVVYYIPEN